MTDIFIKSFNRPFYLDRCISSAYAMVSGNFRITVLDDGTPEKYLKKIEQKFPEVIIRKSAQYPEKIQSIEENIQSGKEINGFEIPTDLWIHAAKEASDFFIMTEDDVWFTEKINIDKLVEDMQKYQISLLKLGWLGNFSDDRNIEISGLNTMINRTVPKSLFLGNQKVMEAFFHNKLKFFTLLYKLGIVNNETRRKYWALNSILMGLYRKEYWLQIWNGMQGKVDEKKQLINASVYYRKHRSNPNFVSRTKHEVMKTTFQSSATNSYHQYGDSFDVNLFNHLINEAWLREDFDAMQNFPKDFSLAYFETFIKNKIDVKEFRKWVEQFKNQYRKLGADVDF